jgi:hypothetical protein
MPPVLVFAAGRVPPLPLAAGGAGTGEGGRAHPAEQKRTCRQRQRRQGHVSPGPGVPPPTGVLFDKNFRRWSFLAFQWQRWSDASKIRYPLARLARLPLRRRRCPPRSPSVTGPQTASSKNGVNPGAAPALEGAILRLGLDIPSVWI